MRWILISRPGPRSRNTGGRRKAGIPKPSTPCTLRTRSSARLPGGQHSRSRCRAGPSPGPDPGPGAAQPISAQQMRGVSPAGGSVYNLAKFGVTGFSDRVQRAAPSRWCGARPDRQDGAAAVPGRTGFGVRWSARPGSSRRCSCPSPDRTSCACRLPAGSARWPGRSSARSAPRSGLAPGSPRTGSWSPSRRSALMAETSEEPAVSSRPPAGRSAGGGRSPGPSRPRRRRRSPCLAQDGGPTSDIGAQSCSSGPARRSGHLRKVFAKPAISSRRELDEALRRRSRPHAAGPGRS